MTSAPERPLDEIRRLLEDMHEGLLEQRADHRAPNPGDWPERVAAILALWPASPPEPEPRKGDALTDEELRRDGTAVIVYREPRGAYRCWGVGAMRHIDNDRTLRDHCAIARPGARFVGFVWDESGPRAPSAGEGDRLTAEGFAAELRDWWSFDERQQHTHSWHSRENFIETRLPLLLSRLAPARGE